MSGPGSKFESSVFKAFCRTLDMLTVAISSYHHGTNWQVEWWIQSIKHIFKKCSMENHDFSLALLSLCVCPIAPKSAITSWIVTQKDAISCLISIINLILLQVMMRTKWGEIYSSDRRLWNVALTENIMCKSTYLSSSYSCYDAKEARWHLDIWYHCRCAWTYCTWRWLLQN